MASIAPPFPRLHKLRLSLREPVPANAETLREVARRGDPRHDVLQFSLLRSDWPTTAGHTR